MDILGDDLGVGDLLGEEIHHGCLAHSRLAFDYAGDPAPLPLHHEAHLEEVVPSQLEVLEDLLFAPSLATMAPPH